MVETPLRLSVEDFGLKLYSRFPPKYREDDYFQNLSLKRFLEVLADGGFSYIIEDTNGLLDLHDPEFTKSGALLPLYEQYGLKLFNGIPEEYLRYLLPHLGEAWEKKGSTDVIEYVTSSLSGIKTSVEVEYEDGAPIVTVRLEMDTALSDFFPDSNQFQRILTNFLPYYCDLLLIYSYVFYEYGKIKAVEEFVQNDVVISNEYDSANILNADGTNKLSPLLNIMDIFLNDDFVLNKEYLPDYIIDDFEDKVNTIFNDSKQMDRDDYKYIYQNSWFVLNEMDYAHLNACSIVAPTDFNIITQNGKTEIAYFTKDKIIRS